MSALLSRYLREFSVSLILPESQKEVALQRLCVNLADTLLSERKTPTVAFNEVLNRLEQVTLDEMNISQPVHYIPLNPTEISNFPEILKQFTVIVENAIWALVPLPQQCRSSLIEAACLTRLLYGVSRKFPSLTPAAVLTSLTRLTQEPGVFLTRTRKSVRVWLTLLRTCSS